MDGSDEGSEAQLGLHTAVAEVKAPPMQFRVNVPVDETVCVLSQARVHEEPLEINPVQVPAVWYAPRVGLEQGLVMSEHTAVGGDHTPDEDVQVAVDEPDER